MCDGREKSFQKKEHQYSPPSDEGYSNSLREESEALDVEEQALRSKKKKKNEGNESRPSIEPFSAEPASPPREKKAVSFAVFSRRN